MLGGYRVSNCGWLGLVVGAKGARWGHSLRSQIEVVKVIQMKSVVVDVNDCKSRQMRAIVSLSSAFYRSPDSTRSRVVENIARTDFQVLFWVVGSVVSKRGKDEQPDSEKEDVEMEE